MIRRIWSSLPTFKAVTFRPGLNILLADRTPESTERQTRNRAGKSSLVEAIHFLTGSKADAGTLFRKVELQNYTFAMSVDVGGDAVAVERSGATPTRVSIGDLDAVGPPQGVAVISNEDWKALLGGRWFRLSDDERAPSMRALLSYFVRREANGGFLTPGKYFTQQGRGEQQICLMYLLGLDWRIAARLQEIREDDEVQARRRRESPVLDAGELRAVLAREESAAAELRQAVQEFRVLPEYGDLEQEVAAVTDELGRLADLDVVDRRQLRSIERSLESDVPPSIADVSALYEEAGVLLPGLVRQRFEDVRDFHESIVANRRLYLEGEQTAANQRISSRQAETQRLDARRSQLQGLLGEHGALEQLMAMQRSLGEAEQNVARLREQYATSADADTKRAELRVERSQELLRLQQDFREQEETLKAAAIAFERASVRLYEEPGTLDITADSNGPVIRPAIQGDRSAGVRRMEVFCFDMVLVELATRAGISPGFLVHDSHLFDGVDVRQVGAALEYGRDLAMQLGFQYIVTLNSDDWPQLVDRLGSDAVVEPRLTDATDDGGLFGFRFD